jgi:SAM-dependent methyltransferase
MKGKVSERLRWAVETLDVRPADRLLEIGCGHGVAVSLVSERLDGGTITALDRSATMIAMARRRNREHVAAGRAILRTEALERADLGERRFDKAFAFHVNLFWREPAGALEKIARALRPGGALYLFDQPLSAGRLREQANRLVRILEANRYRVDDVRIGELRPSPAYGVIARP